MTAPPAGGGGAPGGIDATPLADRGRAMSVENDDPGGGDGGSDDGTPSSVQVAVRVRPFLPSESGAERCVDVLAPPAGSAAWEDDVGSPPGSSGRKRPRNKKPASRSLRIGGESGPTFTFDRTLPPAASQREVYAAVVRPLVQQCLRGYNATVVAYGQTGSGKTYTILGPANAGALEEEAGGGGGEAGNGNGVGVDDNDGDGSVGTSASVGPSQAGVIPRALRELFEELDDAKARLNGAAAGAAASSADEAKDGGDDENDAAGANANRPEVASDDDDDDGTAKSFTPYRYEVRVQFLELYGEEIRDLLSPGDARGVRSKLTIRDGGPGDEPEVIGASEVRVRSAEEALLCLTRGMLRRVTGATAMNAESSRSHAIMSVVVEQITTSRMGGEEGGDGGIVEEVEVKRSKFHFVDLAGSERQKRTNAVGRRLKEGIDINKGLLVLGNVISALGDPKKRGNTFVPYRDSKLTRLLKGSLGGNHRTLMIACVSPASTNLEESLNCLRYANRARNIQNRAVMNLDAGSRLVAELRVQVKTLAGELLRVRGGNGGAGEDGSGGDGGGEGPFTDDLLRSLAGGADSTTMKLPSSEPSGGGGGGGGGFASPPAESFATPARATSRARRTTAAADTAGGGGGDRENARLLREAWKEAAGARRDMATAREEAEEAHRKVDDYEMELSHVRAALQRAREESHVYTEELFTARAEREYHRLKAEDAVAGAAAPAPQQEGGDSTMEGEEKGGGEGDGVDRESVFVARTAEYEREVASLRAALRESKVAGNAAGSTRIVTGGDDATHAISSTGFSAATTAGSFPTSFTNPDEKDLIFRESAITRANKVIEMEKSHLQEIKQTLGQEGQDSSPDESKTNGTLDGSILDESYHEVRLDEEAAIEHTEIQTMTNRYLAEESDAEDEKTAARKSSGGTGNPEGESDDQDGSDEKEEHILRIQQKTDAHLLELSKSIAAKEELIEQLHLSQEKYDSMRTFYEEKLHLMEQQVQERENERESLVHELRKHEEDSQHFNDLQKKLTAKEKHIADLKKRQRELASLTKVSSRNETVVARLRQDVTAMKRQKVELQRHTAKERKGHMSEMQKLKKLALQRDREATKWKQVSERKTTEADTMQRKAKSHLEEVGKLRTKYREAEKRLRMQTLKRGVMERAGLDPVMVGRRGGRPRPTSASSSESSALTARSPRKRGSVRPTTAEANMDQIRSYLDAKVAEVGRKESAADKLAHEWEDHLELVTRKEDLTSKAEGNADDGLNEELEALNVQITFKEGRIRQLTRRLGERPTSGGTTAASKSFLEEKSFKRACGRSTALSAAQLTSKMLFGMVVRERRRVASLARTASALDQKAVDCQNALNSKEAALLSHIEEERQLRESMAQNQDDHILSLMSMVREEEERNEKMIRGLKDETKPGTASPLQKSLQITMTPSSESMVLLLSNERIGVLERQLAELQGEKETKEVYKGKEAKAKSELEAKTRQCEELQSELKHLKSSLRQIRYTVGGDEQLSSTTDLSVGIEDGSDSAAGRRDSRSGLEIDNIIQEALHPPSKSPRKKASISSRLSTKKRLKIASPHPKSPKIIKGHVHDMHSSDSEDDEETPEWAGDIMADLALIAEGEMPPALKQHKSTKKKGKRPPMARKTTSTLSNASSRSGASKQRHQTSVGDSPAGESVFDRLSDPLHFTGIQKVSFSEKKEDDIDRSDSKRPGSSRGRSASGREQDEHKHGSREGTPPTEWDQFKLQDDKFSPPSGLSKPSSQLNDSTVREIVASKNSDGATQNEPTPAHIPAEGDHSDSMVSPDNRSVFERLQSPSHMTFSSKQKKGHVSTKKKKFQDVECTEQEDLNFSPSDAVNLPPVSSALPGSPQIIKTKDDVDSPLHDSRAAPESEEYSNVFERLQRQTTASFAVKHQPEIEES